MEVAKVDLAKAVAGSATKEGRMVGVWVEVGSAADVEGFVETAAVDSEPRLVQTEAVEASEVMVRSAGTLWRTDRRWRTRRLRPVSTDPYFHWVCQGRSRSRRCTKTWSCTLRCRSGSPPSSRRLGASPRPQTPRARDRHCSRRSEFQSGHSRVRTRNACHLRGKPH